jgi:hypothetical protein
MVPNLVNNGILDVAGAAAFTALIVQQTKFLLEYAVKTTNENHDSFMRLYVNAVAIAVVVVSSIVSGTLNVHNGEAWFTAITQGFGVGIAAIAGYHLLNGPTPQTPQVQQVQSEPIVAAPPVLKPVPSLEPVMSPAAGSAAQANIMTAPIANTVAQANSMPAPAADGMAQANSMVDARPQTSVDPGTVTITGAAPTLASWIMQYRATFAGVPDGSGS